jgi:hypothetical protein
MRVNTLERWDIPKALDFYWLYNAITDPSTLGLSDLCHWEQKQLPFPENYRREGRDRERISKKILSYSIQFEPSIERLDFILGLFSTGAEPSI